MPGVKAGRGTPFLDRELRKGAAQQKLMDVPQPGGLGGPSPTGLGGTNVRPNQAPAAAPPAQAAAPQQDLSKIPARAKQPATGTGQRLNAIPMLDDEFPASDLVNSTGTGTNIAATGYGERFYRRYGRYPTNVDMSIIALRRQFETTQGRSPTRDELLAAVRQQTVNRQDELLG